MTNAYIDDVRYLAEAIKTPLKPTPSFDAQMTEAIAAAVATAGITAPSEHFLASVRFTAEVCFGAGDNFAAAASEGVATWLDIA
jgi:hypothetical protein